VNSALGYALVLVGLICASFGAVVGLWSGLTRRDQLLPWVVRSVWGFSAAMIASNLVMVGALLQHDFSVKYVAQVGSRSTPTIFTIVSLWSALEGSILFWGAIMGVYLFAFSWLSRHEKGRFLSLSLGVMCAVAVFFCFLIAGPANPWWTAPHWLGLPNPPPDGPGPNPLLQNHPLMIIHPPMLYLGFVGMTVPFGIAAGALLKGELTDAWIAPLRRWTLVPWMFLTIGIILGSWWAYAVLGWGGYWAWDPVENASFHPWLAATAYMHSSMVLERKRNLKLWTLALVLGAFWLTIVGTFMTRSGVFNSVHSFTQSDIGPTFLVFIAIVLVFSVALLVLRGGLLIAETPMESVVSREGSLLFNNLVFVAITFTVFLGTTFPLVTEALQSKRISVGEPYFNKMALPGGLLILFLMGVGPMLPWGKSDARTLKQQFLIPAGVGALVVAACLAFGLRGFMPLAAFGLAAFVVVVTLRELLLPAQARMADLKETAVTAFMRSASRAQRRTGGYIVHLGIVAIIVGIAASAAFKVHTSGTLKPGEALMVGGVKVRFDGLSSGKEPHREWVSANMTITEPSGKEYVRHGEKGPRMNFYERSTDPVGSPLVLEGLGSDVYVSLLSFDSKAGSGSFNTWVFPLVGWIWYSIPILVLGCLIALWPQRKVTRAVSPSAGAAAPPPAPEAPAAP
jgi:cytochrome c-type biogenesis protein CcmF